MLFKFPAFHCIFKLVHHAKYFQFVTLLSYLSISPGGSFTNQFYLVAAEVAMCTAGNYYPLNTSMFWPHLIKSYSQTYQNKNGTDCQNFTLKSWVSARFTCQKCKQYKNVGSCTVNSKAEKGTWRNIKGEYRVRGEPLMMQATFRKRIFQPLHLRRKMISRLVRKTKLINQQVGLSRGAPTYH